MIFVGYIIFGVILFILDLFLSSKYKFNRREKVIFTILYILVISGDFSRMGLINFNKDIFLIGVVELFCQLFYSNYILEKDVFNKNDNFFSFYFIKIILVFFINRELINKVKDVFLSGDDLKLQVTRNTDTPKTNNGESRIKFVEEDLSPNTVNTYVIEELETLAPYVNELKDKNKT